MDSAPHALQKNAVLILAKVIYFDIIKKNVALSYKIRPTNHEVAKPYFKAESPFWFFGVMQGSDFSDPAFFILPHLHWKRCEGLHCFHFSHPLPH